MNAEMLPGTVNMIAKLLARLGNMNCAVILAKIYGCGFG